MKVNEPILVMGFNRPELLAKLVDRLREVQPSRVYLAIDGPRPERAGEAELVAQSRSIANQIDWDCDVTTLFQETNLGCGLGVSTAISWFFQHEERGIILEDDILPTPSFFGYCEVLLDRYQDDDRVFAISGCNFVPTDHQSNPDKPYRFTNIPHIWGWASWRRSWQDYRLDIEDWRTRLPLRSLWRVTHRSLPAFVYWVSTFELLAKRQVDTWDGQLVLTAMENGQLIANSNVNLIENLGFGETATHTIEDRNDLQPLEAMLFPVAEVPVVRDVRADDWTRKNHFLATWRGMLGQAQRFAQMKRGRR